MALVTLAALLAPWWLLALLVAAAFAAMPARGAFAGFVAVALPINVLILALVAPGEPALRLGPLLLGAEGAREGLVGGLRLAAALGGNLALLGRVGAPRLVDGLRLPPRATAFLGALVLAAHDAGRDFARLKEARMLEGAWPAGRLARAREAARLVPLLVVASHRRAEARRDALRLAGHDTGPRFVPVLALAALAAAGRLAFLALPNVALTYVVVFVGGMLHGPRVAATAGALAMLVTDVLLSGLYLPAFGNVPAMALLGVAGGLLRRVDLVGGTRADRAAGVVFAACAGVLGTFLFSATSDFGTWLVAYPGRPEALMPIVLAGLAFNVVPAAVNGALFALAVRPTLAAWRAWRPADAPA